MTDYDIPDCPKCHCKPKVDEQKLMVICENDGILTAIATSSDKSVERLIKHYKEWVDRYVNRKIRYELIDYTDDLWDYE